MFSILACRGGACRARFTKRYDWRTASPKQWSSRGSGSRRDRRISTVALPESVASGLRCGKGLFWIRSRMRARHMVWESIALRRRLPDSQILAHFFKALRPKPANCQQIIDALKRAVRLSHLQNFLRRRRPDSRHLLQFFGSRCIEIHRLGRRFFLGETWRDGNAQAKNDRKEQSDR